MGKLSLRREEEGGRSCSPLCRKGKGGEGVLKKGGPKFTSQSEEKREVALHT